MEPTKEFVKGVRSIDDMKSSNGFAIAPTRPQRRNLKNQNGCGVASCICMYIIYI